MLAKRQIDFLCRMLRIHESRRVLSASGFKRVLAFFAVFVQLASAFLFETPTDPDGQALNLDERFVLVWSDEFNDGALNHDVWGGHYFYGTGESEGYQRDYSYWNYEQLSFDASNLIITAAKREGGPSETGYYASALDTSPNHVFNKNSGAVGYEQTYGYFETRCILPKGAGLNPAFWLLNEGMFEDVTTGVTGCEIDVFETSTDQKNKPDKVGSIYQTIHYGSYNEFHKQEVQGSFWARNPYEEYNTYGLEWNDKEYIFYINGVETARTAFGGACQEPLYLIFSLGVDAHVPDNNDLPAQFVIDYVRAYQYK